MKPRGVPKVKPETSVSLRLRLIGSDRLHPPPKEEARHPRAGTRGVLLAGWGPLRGDHKSCSWRWVLWGEHPSPTDSPKLHVLWGRPLRRRLPWGFCSLVAELLSAQSLSPCSPVLCPLSHALGHPSLPATTRPLPALCLPANAASARKKKCSQSHCWKITMA